MSDGFAFKIDVLPTVLGAEPIPPTPSAPVILNAQDLQYAQGATVNYAMQAAGYPNPTWDLASGTLPPGLSLSAGGLISGTIDPGATLGPYTFTVRATNSEGNDTAEMTWTVTQLQEAPVIVDPGPQSIQAGAFVSISIATSQGHPPMTWDDPTSSLPLALSIASTGNTTTAQISGIVDAGYTEGQIINSTITAENSEGLDSQDITFTVVVDPWAPYTNICARYDFTQQAGVSDEPTVFGQLGAFFAGDNWLEIDDGPAQIKGYPLTLCCWFNTDSNVQNTTIFFAGDRTAAAEGVRIQVRQFGQIRVASMSGGESYAASADAGYNDGEWHFVAGVWPSEKLREVYIDKKGPESDVVEVPIASEYNGTVLGKHGASGGGAEFTGTLDQTTIFQEALTGGELGWLWNEDFSTGEGRGRTWNELEAAYTYTLDRATQFDGASDWYQAEQAAVTDLPFSFGGWFKVTDTTEHRTIAWVGHAARVGDWVSLRVIGTGQVRVTLLENPAQVNATSASVYNDGKFHFAVTTVSASTITLYVDGVEVDSQPNTAGISFAYDRTNIGRHADSSPEYEMLGVVDEVFFYQGTILTANDVAALWAGGSGILNADITPTTLPDAGVIPTHAYNLSSNNAGGDRGLDQVGTLHLTENGQPIDARGIPVSQVESRGTDFDGTDQHLSNPGASLLSTTDFAVSVWVYSDDLTGAELKWGHGIMRSHHGDVTGQWGIGVTSQGRLSFTWWEEDGLATNATKVTATGVISAGSWYHIVCQVNSGTMEMYVNGVNEAVGGLENSGAGWGNAGVEIGQMYPTSPDYVWNGRITEAAFYDTALTAAQISGLHNDGIGVLNRDIIDGTVVLPGGVIPTNTWPLSINQSGGPGHDLGGDRTIVEDRATQLDGANDFFNGGNAITTLPFAVSLWLKSSNTDTQMAFGQYDADNYTDTPWIGVQLNTDGNIYCYFSGTGLVYTSGGGRNDGKWHHVVFAADADTLYLWVDGVEATPRSHTASISVDVNEVQVGRHRPDAPQQFFDGVVDEITTFDSLLALTHATELWNGGSGKLNSDVIANGLAGGTVFPTHGYNLSSNNAGGDRGLDQVGTLHLTENGSPTDAQGIPAGREGMPIDLTPVNGPTDATGIPAGYVPPDPSTSRGSWGLNEQGGTRMDSSGNQMHLQSINAVSYQVGHVYEPVQPADWAVNFSAISNDYLISDLSNWRIGDTLGVVSVWVRTGLTDWQTVLASSEGSGADHQFAIFIDGNGRAKLAITVGGVVVVDVITNVVITDSEWHHVMVTTDGANTTWYIDGIVAPLLGTNGGEWLSSVTLRNNITIGSLAANNSFQTFMDGDIDEPMYFAGITGDATMASELYNNGIGVTSRQIMNDEVVLTGGHKPLNAWPLSKTSVLGPGEDIAGTSLGVELATGNFTSQGDPAQITGNVLTIITWFKTTTHATQTIACVGDSGNSESFQILRTNTGGDILAVSGETGGQTRNANVSGTNGPGGTWAGNNWHMAAMVSNGDSYRLAYCDGFTNENTQPITQDLAYDATSIGRRPSGPIQGFTGSLDNTLLYDGRALTVDQLNWVWNSGIGRTFEDLRDSPDADNPGITGLVGSYSYERPGDLAHNDIPTGVEMTANPTLNTVPGPAGGNPQINLTPVGSPDENTVGIPAGNTAIGRVSLVTDLSPATAGDNPIVQGTLANQPEAVWVSDGTGNAVQFTPSQYMQLAAFANGPISQPVDVFATLQYNTPTDGVQNHAFDGVNATARLLFRKHQDDNYLIYAGVASLVDGPADDKVHTFLCAFNTISELYIDGGATPAVDGFAGTHGMDGITVGGPQALTGNYLNGTYRELVFNCGALTNAERNDIIERAALSYGHTFDPLPETVGPGRARGYDGTSNDFMDVAHSVASQTYSMACWIKTSTGQNRRIMGLFRSTGNQGAFELMLDASGVLRARIENDSGLADTNDFGSLNIADDQWHFVVVSVTATGSAGQPYQVWVDGQEDSPVQTVTSRAFPTVDRLSVGARLTLASPSYWRGGIDEASFWEGTFLTTAQVLAMYNIGIDGTKSYLSAIQADGAIPDPTIHYKLSGDATAGDDAVGTLNLTVTGTTDAEGIPAGD